MIQANIKKPKCCDECPCVYWFLTGEYEGRMMCALMEQVEHCEGSPERYLVDVNSRPEWCPMTDLILPQKCPKCGAKLF